MVISPDGGVVALLVGSGLLPVVLPPLPQRAGDRVRLVPELVERPLHPGPGISPS
jgi:hypothetical protein